MAGRRLFCFAMQSRRRRKKVGGRPLRAGDRGAARTLGQITPSKDAMGRHDRGTRKETWRLPETSDKSAAMALSWRRRHRSMPRPALLRPGRPSQCPRHPVDGCAIGFAGTPKDIRRSVGVMPQWLQRRNARAQSRRISVGELVLSAGTAIVTNEEARSGSFATRKIA